jgi:glycyl-tRNA synthetase
LSPDRIDEIVGLSKRRGFGYPSAEIYPESGPAGMGVEVFASAWDLGPLGVEFKENIKRQWWKACVRSREDVVGMESAVIAVPAMWRAAERPDGRRIALIQCQVCRQRVRIGLPVPDSRALAEIRCPHCGSVGTFGEPQVLEVGVHARTTMPDGQQAMHFLRHDPIQGILVNFANIMRSARRQPPFGVAQIGRSFRNAVAGDQGFRTNEFEQMGMAFFVQPGTDADWHRYWIEQRWNWYIDLGLPEQDLRRVERDVDPRDGATARATDIEFRYGLSDATWGKLEALANRNDADLLSHSRASGVDLSCYDQRTGLRWMPYVITPTAGLSRCLLAFLASAMSEDFAPDANGVAKPRSVLRLDHRLSPVKVAVLPLSRNPELSPAARDLAAALRRDWTVEFDDSGAIGRRYRRQDEIGTPFCVTLDFSGLADHTVTVRERDTMKQDRVSLDRLQSYLAERLRGCY